MSASDQHRNKLCQPVTSENKVSVQSSSVQDAIYALGKACAPPRLSEVSPALPLKRFQCSSDWRWPSLVLSRKIVQRFLFQRLSPPGDQWCDVLVKQCPPRNGVSQGPMFKINSVSQGPVFKITSVKRNSVSQWQCEKKQCQPVTVWIETVSASDSMKRNGVSQGSVSK